MANLKYVKGDATNPVGYNNKIIAHICNNLGVWGAGFVLALSKKYPKAEEYYRLLKDMRLGYTQFCFIGGGVIVANMIAQDGINSGKIEDRVDYPGLEECLNTVFEFAKRSQASVHMPKIGSGLAGGDWNKIEGLITECVKKYEVNCTVYIFN